MTKVGWVAGLGLGCAWSVVAACGGNVSSGPAAADSGAAASAPNDGQSSGGRSSTEAEGTAGRSAGTAGEPEVAMGGGGKPNGGERDTGAAGDSNAGAAGESDTGAAGVSGAELEPLPFAGLGPCRFLPPIGSPTQNPDCPNAVFEGDLKIATASDLERLSGCQRITGNLTVNSRTLTSLKGLEALQLIDGDLDLQVTKLQEGVGRQNPNLTGLSGLDGLACVAGNAEIDDWVGGFRDVTALGNLVEVGGNLGLQVSSRLSSLRRVFGVTTGNTDPRHPPSLPRFEVAIGGIERHVSAPQVRFVGAANDCFWEGVLGCDWTVETQAALDALADVMFASGSLAVSGSVSSLAPLQNLQKLRALKIDAAAVDSVEPLRNLRGRASKLELANLNVATVDALAQLGPVPEVRIAAVPKLRTLTGLGKLQAQHLVISDAPELESLADLSLLAKPYNVELKNAPKLENAQALSVIRDVYILTLNGLGLENLPDFGDIRIDFLRIENNVRLQSLRGFAGVTSVRSPDIHGNTVLPDCEVAWFGALIQHGLATGVNGPSGPCP